MDTVQDDGRVFVDMPDDSSNPCLNCGACCSKYRISFYHGEMDSQPFGFVPSEMVTKITPFFACMQGTEAGNGRCVALTGVIGKEIGCSIYKNRPSPCREFPVWLPDGTPNEACQSLRKQLGIDPLKPTR